MWPFNNQKRLLKKAFGKYLDDDAVQNILEGNMEFEPPQKKKIQYILLFVKESSKTQETIESILDIAIEFDAMIETITSSFISILFNVPLEQEGAVQFRKKLATHLSGKFSSELSILHGETICLVGNFGSKKRLSYTAMIPDYKSKMNRLTSLEFGEIIEI